MKCMIILVIIGATRTVTKGLKKNMESIWGKHSTESLPKTAILGTPHTAESTAVWNLNPEGWGSLLVQEKYEEEKACDLRQQQHNNNKHEQTDQKCIR